MKLPNYIIGFQCVMLKNMYLLILQQQYVSPYEVVVNFVSLSQVCKTLIFLEWSQRFSVILDSSII
jgi:hypothetical protein